MILYIQCFWENSFNLPTVISNIGILIAPNSKINVYNSNILYKLTDRLRSESIFVLMIIII